jgi:beta-xylosidase
MYCSGAGGARYSGNPIVSRFVADPAARVFNDRMYVYNTDDQSNSGNYWDSKVWHAYSSGDLVTWQDEGTVLSLSVFKWASVNAWAPDVVSRNGHYYFYAPVDDTQIGVAIGDTPIGPFTDPIGVALVDKYRDANAGNEPIDPAVLIDDDAQAYLYYGSRIPKVVKLAADMVHLAGAIQDLNLSGGEAACKNTPFFPGCYGEAPWIHKHNGVYYFSYSTGWPGQIFYATSTSPLGPFVYKGLALDFVPGLITNHESIVEFRGKSYMFYHGKAAQGGDYRRSTEIGYLNYNPDGSIQTVAQTAQGVACVP